MTFLALDDAFRSLSLGERVELYRKLPLSEDEDEDEDDDDDEEQKKPRNRGVEMCVFMEKELHAFEEAKRSLVPEEEDE